MECEYLRQLLESYVTPLPFYKPNEHEIGAIQRGKQTSLWYRTTAKTLANIQDTTHMELIIQRTTGFIDWFEVAPTEQHQGRGRLLYQAAEQFFLDIKCETINLTCSGKARGFWETMGFEPDGAIFYTKDLTKRKNELVRI